MNRISIYCLITLCCPDPDLIKHALCGYFDVFPKPLSGRPLTMTFASIGYLLEMMSLENNDTVRDKIVSVSYPWTIE